MVQWYWFALPNVRNENPTRELDGADGIRYREISVQLRVIRQQRQRPTLLPEIDVGVGAEPVNRFENSESNAKRTDGNTVYRQRPGF